MRCTCFTALVMLLAQIVLCAFPSGAQDAPVTPPGLTDELTDVLDVLEQELEIHGEALQKELSEHQGEIEQGLQSTLDELYQSLKSELDAAGKLIDEYNAGQQTEQRTPDAEAARPKPEGTNVERTATVTRAVPLKHLAPEAFSKLAEGMFSVEEIRADKAHKIVLVRGTAEAVKAVEAAAAKMDVAPVAVPNILLHVYFVEASPTPADAKPLPAALQAALSEHSPADTAISYTLAGELLMRVRNECSTESEGMIALRDAISMPGAKVSVNQVSLGADRKSVRLDEFMVGVEGIPVALGPSAPGNAANGPKETRGRTAGFSADVDLAPGRAAIVGKTGINHQGNELLILVEAAPV
ncbi:MAG: hypothetical protein HYV27_22820 [Candidatus Hydrogenedentes bacterium]|nr:hypothetical protein [Candidatus Hydrogenedentota bacterium]